MSDVRCIPCEAKAALNRAKMSFLIEQGEQRAKQQNEDYVIYEDSDDNIYKLAPFSEAYARGERIIFHISRLA